MPGRPFALDQVAIWLRCAAELGQDVLDVVLGRPLGDVQVLADLPVVSPARYSRATSCSRGLRVRLAGAAAGCRARSRSIARSTAPSRAARPRPRRRPARPAPRPVARRCRRVRAAASSTRACRRIRGRRCRRRSRPPSAGRCRGSAGRARRPPGRAAARPGPVNPGAGPLATCWPRNGSKHAARNSMSPARPRPMATVSRAPRPPGASPVPASRTDGRPGRRRPQRRRGRPGAGGSARG